MSRNPGPMSSPTQQGSGAGGGTTLDGAPPMPPSKGSALFTPPKDQGMGNQMSSDPMVQTMSAVKQVEMGLQQLAALYPDASTILAPFMQQVQQLGAALLSQGSSPAALSGAPPMMPPMPNPGQPGGAGSGMSPGAQMSPSGM